MTDTPGHQCSDKEYCIRSCLSGRASIMLKLKGLGGGEVDCRSSEGKGAQAALVRTPPWLLKNWQTWNTVVNLDTETHHVFVTRSNTNAADPPDLSSRMLPYLAGNASGQSSSQPDSHARHRVMAARVSSQR